MSVNYGSKRTVVGAHYGIRDWMVQRVTGVLMALFTIVLLAKLIFSTGSVGYDLWAGIFAPQDRKSTRLNSSHLVISYAVFCLKKKKNIDTSSVCSSSETRRKRSAGSHFVPPWLTLSLAAS